MPIYEAVCLKCGKLHDYIRKVAECHDTPSCCGSKTDKRILSAPAGIMDYQPWEAYESPASGKVITSKAERRQDFKETGTREWTGIESEKRIAEESKKEIEAKEDASIDAAVRTAWANLSPTKKAQALKECGA